MEHANTFVDEAGALFVEDLAPESKCLYMYTKAK
jgi:hypothetical protein